MSFKSIDIYKGRNLLGQDICIPYKEDIQVEGSYLYYEGAPFCSKTSEVARKYFVWNGDGYWEARKAYEDVIYLKPRTKKWEKDIPIYDGNGNIIGTQKETFYGRFTPNEIRYIRENFPEFVESSEGLIFSNYFFMGSDIMRVKELFEYLIREN